MLKPWTIRLGTLIAAAGLLGVAGVPSAQAGAALGTQNPSLPISVSLTSNVAANPDRAGLGDVVAATVVARSNRGLGRRVEVTAALVYPSGRMELLGRPVLLFAGQRYLFFETYTIDRTFEKGTYRLTVQALDGGKTISQATTSITVAY
jgi:hypothetical protein